MTAKIQLIGVKKRFGSKVVLDGIDLTIEKGSSLVVIGGSGTGKSVLIKSIIGILLADSGIIEVDGQDVAQIPANSRDAVNRKFGMLFQGGALFDSLPVWENVAFGPIQSDGMKPEQAREVAIAKLGAVGLGRRTRVRSSAAACLLKSSMLSMRFAPSLARNLVPMGCGRWCGWLQVSSSSAGRTASSWRKSATSWARSAPT